MSIKVTCSSLVTFDKETGQYIRCGQTIKAPLELAGKTVRCPKCGQKVKVAQSFPAPTNHSPTKASAPSNRSPETPASAKTAAAVAEDEYQLAPDQLAGDHVQKTGSQKENSHKISSQKTPPPPAPQSTKDFDDEYQLAPEEPLAPPSPNRSMSTKQKDQEDDSVMELDMDDLFTARETETPSSAAASSGRASLSTDYTISTAKGPTRGVHSGWCEQCGVDMTDEQTACPSCGYDHSPEQMDLPTSALQRGEGRDAAPTPPPVEQEIHSGWCEKCGADMPPPATVCPKCGHEHVIDYSNVEQEPEVPAEERACPKCDAPLPENSKICLECGFHTVERTRYAELARGGDDYSQPPPTGLQHWLRSQISPDSSQKDAMIWVMLFVGVLLVGTVLGVTVMLWMVMGAWALCLLVPTLLLVMTGVIFVATRPQAGKQDLDRDKNKQPGVASNVQGLFWQLLLMVHRTASWRSLAPPFEPQKMLDVRGMQFNDSDLEAVNNLDELQVLDLEGTEISDRALPRLYGRTELKFIVLRNTPVTLSAVHQLQRALPHAWIWS